GRLHSIDGPLTQDDITLQYDEIGRLISRDMNPFGEVFEYDTLGRLSVRQITSVGAFDYNYVGDSERLDSILRPNNYGGTFFEYFSNAGDFRLKRIWNQNAD